MIEAYCRTNLDDCRFCHWPTLFVSVPRIGDRIESQNGTILKVVGITHKTHICTEGKFGEEGHKEEPYIEIELNR